MGILVNESQIGGGGPSNSSRNIGDIFYTTRTDNSLNGAVECNGSQYNFSDFDSNLQNLLDEGKLPYVSIGEFDSMVSEKGWCDKIGYGTNELIIYPVTYMFGSTPITLCYTNIIEWYEVEKDYHGKLLNVKVYDKDTHEELVGYYVKYIPETDCFYVYNNSDENMYGADSVYLDKDGEPITLPTGGEFQATTYFKVPKLSAYIIQKENIPVIGNGITLGFTDGSSNYGFSGVNSSPARTLLTTGTDYGSTVGSVHVSNDNPNKTVGITTDSTKSGMISDLSNDSFTGRVMIQLFNSTTDTAVATCNQVLADVSALNQGDYVIETQLPTEDNDYSWYRLYKSGWVEQGKFRNLMSSGANVTCMLIIPMKDTNYSVTGVYDTNTTAVSSLSRIGVGTKTTQSFQMRTEGGQYSWEVKGFANITN